MLNLSRPTPVSVSERTGPPDIIIARDPGLSDWQYGVEAIILGIQPLGKYSVEHVSENGPVDGSERFRHNGS